jgi:hypothetical protein
MMEKPVQPGPVSSEAEKRRYAEASAAYSDWLIDHPEDAEEEEPESEPAAPPPAKPAKAVGAASGGKVAGT